MSDKLYFGATIANAPTKNLSKGTRFIDDNCNEYIFDGTTWQEYKMRYKDLGLVIDAVNVAAGAYVYSAIIDKTKWVSSITTHSQNAQTCDIGMQPLDSTLDLSTYIVNTITAQAIIVGAWAPSSVSQTSAPAFRRSKAIRVFMKNTSGVVATSMKLKLQLFA